MSQWDYMRKNWDLWEWPLRPSESDVNLFDRLLTVKSNPPKNVLLLGETPELHHLSSCQVDNNPLLGSTHKCDWLQLSQLFRPGAFEAIIGDGVLNVMGGNWEQLLVEACKLLKPGG